MSDVDLLVGTTSIAADPPNGSTGDRPHFDDDWKRVSFGDLAERAVTRRAALERLLPLTRISDRSTMTYRYLVVRGKLRIFKIHIGSGNILMEPDYSYLCIVPARGRGLSDKLFLPFEEDCGLPSHILSKALLLADDHTSPTRRSSPSFASGRPFTATPITRPRPSPRDTGSPHDRT